MIIHNKSAEAHSSFSRLAARLALQLQCSKSKATTTIYQRLNLTLVRCNAKSHAIPCKAVAVSRRGLIETCGLGWVFFGCCGLFWCAVHYLGVLFRCTCNLCSIIICVFQVLYCIIIKYFCV